MRLNWIFLIIVLGQSMVFNEVFFKSRPLRWLPSKSSYYFDYEENEVLIANLPYILYENGDKNRVAFYISYKIII